MLRIVNLMSKSQGLLVQEWKDHFNPLGSKNSVKNHDLKNDNAKSVLRDNAAI